MCIGRLLADRSTVLYGMHSSATVHYICTTSLNIFLLFRSTRLNFFPSPAANGARPSSVSKVRIHAADLPICFYKKSCPSLLLSVPVCLSSELCLLSCVF